jgi:hypothetical protein
LSVPDPLSAGLAETVCPLAIESPAPGAVSEKAFGPLVSGVTVNVSEAVRPAPE